MRRGLHPLSVHLGQAAANATAIQQYSSKFSQDVSPERMVEMVRGIKMYQSHPFAPQRLPTETVWQKGATSLLRLDDDCAQDNSANNLRRPLLLVPSLINKSYILDLTEERSLMRWMNAQGISTYLLDWGDISIDAEARKMSLNDIVTHRLCEAIKHLSCHHESKVDVMGYCMGGTMLIGAASVAQEHIERIVLLAAPWDFHTNSGGERNELARAVRIWSPIVMPTIKERGVLPSSYVQALFASLGSEETVQKFINFSQIDQDSDRARFFVCVEDWLNDDVDIPGAIAQECIQNWFLKNDTAQGRWFVNDKVVRVADISADMLVITSRRDRLVPYECALSVLHQSSPNKCSVIEATTGHIGMIVGNSAIDKIWTPMMEWLKA